MGLIGNVLQPLYLGIRSVLLPTASFLSSPARWLRAISDYRGTTSGGPNFAYDHCVDHITDAQLAGVDLRSWSVAFNGAEPVRAATLERFTAAFAPYGFRPTAVHPCYAWRRPRCSSPVSRPASRRPRRVSIASRSRAAMRCRRR